MPKQIVYVDVDDTLGRSAGTKRVPIPGRNLEGASAQGLGRNYVSLEYGWRQIRTLHRGGAGTYGLLYRLSAKANRRHR